MFYKDAPFTKLQEKTCGLSALPWRPNSTAASRSWRRRLQSSPERPWSCGLWAPRRSITQSRKRSKTKGGIDPDLLLTSMGASRPDIPPPQFFLCVNESLERLQESTKHGVTHEQYYQRPSHWFLITKSYSYMEINMRERTTSLSKLENPQTKWFHAGNCPQCVHCAGMLAHGGLAWQNINTLLLWQSFVLAQPVTQ